MNRIVLGHGGAKGYLMLGSLLCLEGKGLLNDLRHIVGVSVGAVIGLLMTAGYSIPDIVEMSSSLDLTRDFFSLDLSHQGLLSHKTMETFISEALRKKFGLVPSLLQLYRFTCIQFTSVTLNITKSQIEFLDHVSNPEMNAVTAVLMSMSIPVLFKEMRVNGDIYIDGALGEPLPMKHFDDGTPCVGIYMETTKHPDGESVFPLVGNVIDGLISRIRESSLVGLSPACKVIGLKTSRRIDTLGLGLTPEVKESLIAEGFIQTESLDLSSV